MSKVSALYRVSTPNQLKDDDDCPIPAQQTAVARFCEEYNHDLVDEYFEPGVSAYRNSVFDRDVVIHEVIEGAKSGLFTTLLVFKNSRLSRREAEYPWILQELKKYGVIVWEIARNKRLTPLTHEDKLTTYIDGWQAEGESLNISTQSRAGRLSKAYTGGKTGGTPSYGFEISDWVIEKGKRNRPKTYAVWGINNREADMVMQMVEMYEQGHGAKYIAKQLNSNNFLKRSGGEWSSSNIRHALRNPALAGISMYRIDGQITHRTHQYKDLYDPAYYVHKDDNGNYIIDESLVVVPLSRWLNLMNIMAKRPLAGYINPNRKQTYLLSGFLRCGYCGRSMTGITASEEYHKKDGTVSIYSKSGYRCNGKTAGTKCTGPTQISINKIDEILYYELESFFSNFDPQSLLKDMNENSHVELNQLKLELKNTERSLKKTETIKTKWLNEMDENFARNGEYMFSKENIARKITEQEVSIKELQKSISEIKRKLDSIVSRKHNINSFARVLPNWYQQFKKQEIAVQNTMLDAILDYVEVFRDRVEVYYKISIEAVAETKTVKKDFIDLYKVIDFSSH